MLELLFLLLPLAAAYGWYMGRRGAQQSKQQEADRLTREYVTGLNFLLSDQQDKAIELFLEMLKEDSNALEAHLTLGNLFRSRGEVDRAIRIHQSLMESTSLSFEQRLLACQQLGRDYMAAGLYDRAEDMFLQLRNEVEFRLNALQQLLQIYQLTSDWQKAIDVAERLNKLGEDKRKEMAHFYCELAALAMSSDALDKARSYLKKALSSDKNCARASIMLGRIEVEQSHYLEAVNAFEAVLEQDRAFVTEMLPQLQLCYQYLDNPEGWFHFLTRCVDADAGAAAELLLADEIEKQPQGEDVQNYINRQLGRHPTMRMFYRLMDHHVAEAEEGRAKDSLLLLRNMVGEQIKNKPRYRCIQCGFTSHSLYWHCPSCRSWSTVKPIRGLDGL